MIANVMIGKMMMMMNDDDDDDDEDDDDDDDDDDVAHGDDDDDDNDDDDDDMMVMTVMLMMMMMVMMMMMKLNHEDRDRPARRHDTDSTNNTDPRSGSWQCTQWRSLLEGLLLYYAPAGDDHPQAGG